MNEFTSLSPGLWLLAGVPLVAWLKGPARKVLQLALPCWVLGQVLWLVGQEPPTAEWTRYMGLELQWFKVDSLRLLFAVIFALITVLGGLYALHVENPLFKAGAWLSAGATLSLVFAGDLLTFLVFWELNSVGSVLLILSSGTEQSRGAALRYFVLHGLGGSLLLGGILALLHGGGSLAVQAISPEAGFAGWMMLLGVAVNAAIPPLGAWLPDAYPRSSESGSVVLSAFTTKSAVFALLALFPAWKVLLVLGVGMALYGVVFAILENNLRRLLSYHIISQVGFMVAGVGMGTSMGHDGAAAHAFSHILYKALLFMAAGAVLYATGREHLNQLGGLSRRLPWVTVFFMVGAASISGLPLFNGFVSKSITLTAAGQGGWPWAELGLQVASVGTFLSIGLKAGWFGFVHPPDRAYSPLKALPWNIYAAMGLTALLCLGMGLWPGPLYALLPGGTDYHPWTVSHVAEAVQLLTMSAVGFFLIADKLQPKEAVTLDVDWFYRRPLPVALMATSRALVGVHSWLAEVILAGVEKGKRFLADPLGGAERFFGRGVTESSERGPEAQAEAAYPGVYRLPLGVTILVVLSVFAVLALVNLATRPG